MSDLELSPVSISPRGDLFCSKLFTVPLSLPLYFYFLTLFLQRQPVTFRMTRILVLLTAVFAAGVANILVQGRADTLRVLRRILRDREHRV